MKKTCSSWFSSIFWLMRNIHSSLVLNLISYTIKIFLCIIAIFRYRVYTSCLVRWNLWGKRQLASVWAVQWHEDIVKLLTALLTTLLTTPLTTLFVFVSIVWYSMSRTPCLSCDIVCHGLNCLLKAMDPTHRKRMDAMKRVLLLFSVALVVRKIYVYVDYMYM